MRPGLIVFAVVMSMLALATDAGAQSSDTAHLVAVDADITGNTATSLGPLNACTRVDAGGTVKLDLVVDAVPASRPLIAYQINVEYDPNLLEVTAADNEFLLGAKGAYEPFEGLSDPLPDRDGNYLIIIADIGSQPDLNNIESGPGVLTRLTFKGKGQGLSTVAPVFNPPDEYPALIDMQNTTIGVDSIGAASVAVGQVCPGPIEATPVITELPPIDQIPGLQTPVLTPTPAAATEPAGQSPTPTASSETRTPRVSPTGTGGEDGKNITGLDESDGGTGTGTVVAVAALALAGAGLAGGGALMLLRRRGKGSAGDFAP